MVLDIAFVSIGCCGLYIAQIIPRPDIQPLPHGEPGQIRIGPAIDGHGGGLQLLPDLFLCFASERALDLLPRAGVPARGDSGLPIGVFLPVPCDGLFSDGSAAFGSLFCHKKHLSFQKWLQ